MPFHLKKMKKNRGISTTQRYRTLYWHWSIRQLETNTCTYFYFKRTRRATQ
jgi:hypothetical protein